MNLHEDSNIFYQSVQLTAESIGLSQILIEKDYWVTKALKDLA